jgi:hypothetical protein
MRNAINFRKNLNYILISFALLCVSIAFFIDYFSGGSYTPLTWITWLLCLVLIVAKVFPFQMKKFNLTESNIGKLKNVLFYKLHKNWTILLSLLLLVIATVAFRWYNIENLPFGYQGMHIDTAYNSEIAFRIIDGKVNFSPVIPGISYVRDAVLHYYLAFVYMTFGKSIFSLRSAGLILGVVDVLLLFSICQLIFKKTWISFLIGLLYACSATDTILTYSLFEHTISTPLLLLSFILLYKATKNKNLFFYASSGILIGIGLSSSYYFMILSVSFVLYLIHAFISKDLKKQLLGIAIFIIGIFVAVIPKIVYLVYNLNIYLMRIHDVVLTNDSRIAGGIMTVLRQRFTSTMELLFSKIFYDKWLLGEYPVIDKIIMPLVIISTVMLFLQLKKRESVFILAVILLSISINVLSYPMDYRFMNTMPFFYLAIGSALYFFSNVQNSRMLKIITIVAVVVAIIANYVYYQNVNLGNNIFQYHTTEIKVVQLSMNEYQNKHVYYSIADPSWVANYFMITNPGLQLEPLIRKGRLWQQECNSSDLPEFNRSAYDAIERNQNNLKGIVFIFDDAACNQQIKEFLRDRVQFSERFITFKEMSNEIRLTILDNFTFSQS